MYKLIKRVIWNVTAILFICLIPVTVSSAASSQLINYDGKTVKYTGKQPTVQLDGKEVSQGDTPGILINGFALLSCQDIFENGLGADYSFNSTTKMITIEQNDVVIKMVLGSVNAYVNGVPAKLSITPRKVKYESVNKTKIMVPARFVAEALGYTYNWNNSNSLIGITSPWKIYYDNSWHIYKGTKGNVTIDSKSVDVSSMPSVIIDNTALLQARKVFQTGMEADYVIDNSANTVTISKNGNTIVLTLGSNKAMVNNKEYTMSTAARVMKHNRSNSSYVMVPGGFVAEHLGYTYSWDKTTKTSMIVQSDVEDPETDPDGTDTAKNYVTWTSSTEAIDGTVYTNLLKQLSADYSNNNDIITLEGLSALNSSVTSDESLSCLYIDLPGTLNGIGEKAEDITDGYCLKGISVSTVDQNTRIIIKKTENSEYYTSTSGNKLTLFLFEGTEEGYSLKFNKPDEVKFSDIVDDDQYLNKRFVISIPGNYVDYYTNNPILKANSIIKDVTVTLNSDGNTEITVTTSKIQGYQLTDHGAYITVKVGDPKDIYDNIIVLDAGHGGYDSGAIKGSVMEKNINFSIIYEKAKKYFDNKNCNVKAYWTRTTDTFVTLDDRAAFAESVGADLFISLHTNSYSSTSVKGMEIYYSASNNDTTQSGLSSYLLASHFNTSLKADLGCINHGVGVKTAKYVVVHKNTVPAILIELGFITNASDLANMTNETYQDKFAQSIYNSTVGIFNKYPTGR